MAQHGAPVGYHSGKCLPFLGFCPLFGVVSNTVAPILPRCTCVPCGLSVQPIHPVASSCHRGGAAKRCPPDFAERPARLTLMAFASNLASLQQSVNSKCLTVCSSI